MKERKKRKNEERKKRKNEERKNVKKYMVGNNAHSFHMWY